MRWQFIHATTNEFIIFAHNQRLRPFNRSRFNSKIDQSHVADIEADCSIGTSTRPARYKICLLLCWIQADTNSRNIRDGIDDGLPVLAGDAENVIAAADDLNSEASFFFKVQ